MEDKRAVKILIVEDEVKIAEVVQELIDSALGMEFDGYDRTIDSHIKNLRAKIESDSAVPVYIRTVRGVGYRFGGDGA